MAGIVLCRTNIYLRGSFAGAGAAVYTWLFGFKSETARNPIVVSVKGASSSLLVNRFLEQV